MKNSIHKFVWPFYRYCVLFPKRNEFDLLEWLFINLVVYQNQMDNLDITNINDDTVLKVNNLFKIYFSSIVDENLFEIIKVQVYEKYVEKDNDGVKLNADVVNNLNSYSDLFSDSLTIQYFFQDGVTGKVFPHFYDTIELEDILGFESDNSIGKIKEFKHENPRKKQIKAAYDEFLNVSRSIDDEASFEEYYIDFEDEMDDFEWDEQEEKNDDNSSNDSNFNVIFLPNKRDVVYYDVNVEIDDESIMCRSPFGNYSDNLMTDCVLKSKSISKQVNDELLQLEALISPKKEELYIDFSGKDLASSLTYCSVLYRLIENLDDKELKKTVKKIDKYFKEKDKYFYLECGRFLEGIIEKIQYDESDKLYRDSINDMYLLQRRLDQKFWKYNDRFKIKEKVFGDWKNKYKYKNTFKSFQSDFMDVLLKSNAVNCKNFYDGFISDVLSIYRLRNKGSAHYNSEISDITYDNSITQDIIDKLVKITKVIIEMI